MAFLTWLYQQEMTTIATPTMVAEAALLATGIGVVLMALLTIVYLVNRWRQPATPRAATTPDRKEKSTS